MSTTKKVFANTAIQLIGKVITATTTLLVTIIITRRFGATGFGEFILATTYAAFFYVISDFGLNAIVNIELTNGKKPSYYFSNLLSLRAVLSTFLFICALIPLSFLPYSGALKKSIFVACFTIFTQALFQVSTAFFQYNLKYQRATVAMGVGRLASLAFIAWAASRGMGVVYLIASYAGGELLGVLIAFVLVKPLVGKLRWGVDFELWKKLLIAALPLGLTAIFSVINQKADTIILSLLLSNHEVGIYGVAYKVYEVVLVYPTFFMNAAYPILLKHRKLGLAKLRNSVKLSAVFLVASALLASVVGIALAPWIINVVGGFDFADSALVLKILLLGLPILFPSALLWWLVIVLGKQKYLPRIYLLGALINICANLIFIPKFGVAASAAITWLDEIVVVLLTGSIVIKELKSKNSKVKRYV